MTELEARYDAAWTALDDLRDEARRIIRVRSDAGEPAHREAGYLAAAFAAQEELKAAKRTVVRVG